MEYYHNPRCWKSREGLKLLESKGIRPTTILYLKNPPSKEKLTQIIQLLNLSAFDLIRKNEAVYKESFKNNDLSENECIDALLNNPILIERPIFVTEKSAVIGRPPEKILEII